MCETVRAQSIRSILVIGVLFVRVAGCRGGGRRLDGAARTGPTGLVFLPPPYRQLRLWRLATKDAGRFRCAAARGRSRIPYAAGPPRSMSEARRMTAVPKVFTDATVRAHRGTPRFVSMSTHRTSNRAINIAGSRPANT